MATFQQYLNALRQSTVYPTSRLYFLNEDGTPYYEITDEYIKGGSINVSYNNGVRRTASITLFNDKGQYDSLIERGVLLNQKVKVLAGIYVGDEEYLVPQGVFYINNPVSAYQPANKTIQLNLVDKWGALDGTVMGTLDGIYQINVGNSLIEAIRTLLLLPKGNNPAWEIVKQYGVGSPEAQQALEALRNLSPTEVIDPIAPIIDQKYLDDPSLYEAPYTLRIESNSTYANMLLGINTMLVSSCGYDAEGILRFTDANTSYSDFGQPLAYDFFVDSKELYSASYTYKMSDIYNEVQVVGAMISGYQIQGRAQNNNPASALSIDKIGRRTLWVSDTKFNDIARAQEYAEYELKRRTALQRAVSFECSPIFHLKENDLITITRTDINKSYVPEIFVVNGYTLPLGGGNMSVNAVSINELI